MNLFEKALFGFGVFIPSISIFTLVICAYERFVHRRDCSPILVPVIGPFFLSGWLFTTGRPHWMLVLPWILDPATFVFWLASPRLAYDWWSISRFTRLRALTGHRDKMTVRLTLHRTGKYHLTMKWKRSTGDTGVIEISTMGNFTTQGDDFLLLQEDRPDVLLRKATDGVYRVADGGDAQGITSLQGWILS